MYTSSCRYSITSVIIVTVTPTVHVLIARASPITSTIFRYRMYVPIPKTGVLKPAITDYLATWGHKQVVNTTLTHNHFLN